ncbi:MCE family protein [Amycolatopsis cihanbeyliensis]|uniref:Virulence factor Mce-like protein n=1 Tax=Amycolatopsis cihanbeyliensis TaxID=1128664 RepID=A0A542CSB0_AMYCI|nr:MCE family protein [Amycolatopsis cihanbeyliensis]TQI93718.1 virulence factor Mce-like protein [Amycolatopsis cihanbeyliensis]
MRAARKDIGRAGLALRGLAAAVVMAVAAGTTVALGNGAFDGDPLVHATLPASAGPVRDGSPVRYRGITVGTLAAVEGGAALRLRMDPERLGQVPGNVRVRLLPRSLFGDQYVDLGLPEGTPPRGRLAGGARLRPDTSGGTVRLYAAYTRLYDLIAELRPAQLQVALGTVADTLRGRGRELGAMIDEAGALAAESGPLLDTLGTDLETVAGLGRDLAAAVPDLMHSLDDAVALSRTVVAKRQSLRDLLAAGIDLTTRSERLLVDNADRVIRLARATGPLAAALGRHPGAARDTMDAAGFFLDGAKRAFSTGRFAIEAALTLDDPHPYTAADCPRYPGMAGPNCGQPAPPERAEPAEAGSSAPPEAPAEPERAGGKTGPVGGQAEQETMRRLGPLLPEAGDGIPAPSTDLLSLLLGPLLRGTRVVVP